MIFLGELRVEARLENLRVISFFITGISQRLNLTEKVLFDIELALEEASVNIVKHAYPAGQMGDMVIVVELIDNSLRITLTDWGVPLHAEDVKPLNLEDPIETRIKGGMGLYFINTLMDEVYRNTSEELGLPNTLTLIKNVEILQPGVQLPSAVRERNAMLTVSQLLSTQIDLNELLEITINELVDVISAEGGTLYLVDSTTQEIYSRVLLDETGELGEIRMRLGEGIAGDVALNGQLVNIRDAYTDARFQPEYDRTSGHHTRSMLVVPLRNHQQEIIGVVQLVNKRGGYFTSRDERLVTAMAAQVAVSIENARLYAQEIRQRLLNQELETARQIQRSFLPEDAPKLDGWDISCLWKPMRDVGGDFYDFFELPDCRLGVVIADVSGKGVPAALFMAYSETVLRFAMTLDLSPGQMLARANRFMIANSKSKMFTTVFVGLLDTKTGIFEYASAGHNPPLIYKSSEARSTYLDVSGVALGLFDDAHFASRRAILVSGDVLLLYTDGLIEAINDEEDEYGEERLAFFLSKLDLHGASEVIAQVMHDVESFASQDGIFDDITLLVLRRDKD